MRTYLIEIIRLQDRRGNNTGSGSCLHNYIDTAEEDVLAGLNGGSVGLGLDGKDGAIILVRKLGTVGFREDGASSLGEVAIGLAAKRRVGRTSICGDSVSSPSNLTQYITELSRINAVPLRMGEHLLNVWLEPRVARARVAMDTDLENMLAGDGGCRRMVTISINRGSVFSCKKEHDERDMSRTM